MKPTNLINSLLKPLTIICLLLIALPLTAQQLPLGEVNFKAGEVLDFRLHYGFLNAGTVKISLATETLNGKSVLHGKLRGRTSGMVDVIYKVDDIYESYFDPKTTLPIKAIRNIREGSYRYYDEVTYDHNANTITSQRNGLVPVPQKCLDMASVAFYLRRMDFSKLKQNEIIALDTYFADEIFPFYIVYKGIETVSISSGKYRCHKFVPIVEPGRVFENNDDMTVWFSDDKNRIPISIKFDIIVGSFRCDLTSFENLKYPLTSKIK